MTIDLSTFSPAEGMIECGGEMHRIRWEAGELLAAE